MEKHGTYITDRIKRNCDTALIFTSETVNYTFSKPAPS